ncbi:MAG: DUF4835 family protein, partial [Flavobacteriales bacterium]
MKRLVILLFPFFIPVIASAQELQCDVTIIPPRVMISGPEIFQTMETTIEEFLNTRRWSRDDWNPKERIECTMQIT